MPGSPAPDLSSLAGCSPAELERVRRLLAEGRLGEDLAGRYPERHQVRDDRALYLAAMALKDRFLQRTPPLDRVRYDARMLPLADTLGTLSAHALVQGSRLRARREIRIATLFRDAPAAFLRMVLVHELAHLKEPEHSKAFYQLCTHMEPDYARLEFDLRLYLLAREADGPPRGQPPWAIG